MLERAHLAQGPWVLNPLSYSQVVLFLPDTGATISRKLEQFHIIRISIWTYVCLYDSGWLELDSLLT